PKGHHSIRLPAFDRLVLEIEHLFARCPNDLVFALSNDPVFDILGAPALTRLNLTLGAPHQLLVKHWRNAVGLGDHVRSRVVPEHEPHSLLGPTLELRGEREVGVPPQQNVAEPGPPAQGNRPVADPYHPLDRRTVARSLR